MKRVLFALLVVLGGMISAEKSGWSISNNQINVIVNTHNK